MENSRPGDRPKVGVGVFVTHPLHPGCVLIGRRLGTAAGAGEFALPGGHVEFGETFQETAVREVLEETSLVVHAAAATAVVAVLNCYRVATNYHYVVPFVRAAVAMGDASEPINTEPTKCEGWKWMRWGNNAAAWDAMPLFAPLADFREQKENLALSPWAPSAIIFDADGTLIDSLAPHVEFCRSLAARHPELGVVIPPATELTECRALAAAPMARFLERAGFGAADSPFVAALVAEYDANFGTDFPTPPFAGIASLLATLGELRGAGLSLAVVSSNTSANVLRGLAQGEERASEEGEGEGESSGGLSSYFEFVWGIDNAHREKRTSVADALRRLDVPPSRCLYVGDTQKDCACAAANGVRFVGVTYGFEDLKAARAEGNLHGCVDVVSSPMALKVALLDWWSSLE